MSLTRTFLLPSSILVIDSLYKTSVTLPIFLAGIIIYFFRKSYGQSQHNILIKELICFYYEKVLWPLSYDIYAVLNNSSSVSAWTLTLIRGYVRAGLSDWICARGDSPAMQSKYHGYKSSQSSLVQIMQQTQCKKDSWQICFDKYDWGSRICCTSICW